MAKRDHMERHWGESKMGKTATLTRQGRTGSRAVMPVAQMLQDPWRAYDWSSVGHVHVGGAGHLDWHSW